MEEALRILEQKIAALIDLISKIRVDNARLLQENVHLMGELQSLRSLHMDIEEHKRKISQEKELTKSVVDELIQRISSLSQSETLS